ncbi:divergent PAP2 family protein [Paludicola sp. MB14-C6]|uniref:divergent PAP2 family protein n=1 Tax=Paludihabitans sp. MB14-C6 TaxID=3070656 RepID=UPI0027DD067C|nr:divergent PAP2 family protein [Paludicola sp. MB14-C6]WMJ23034.1 divergent PAP2 family protein [Paludicola sp. MB14-C6]
MTKISDLFSNYVLNVAVISWISAQVIKTLLNLITTKKMDLERLFGAGGMPSAHSASVCGLTIAVSKTVGFASPLFAISFLLSAIVMYDAMGVRRAAGEHAKVINLIVKKNNESKGEAIYIPKNKNQLKEFLGHTPLEVMGGAMLGILVAILIPVY